MKPKENKGYNTGTYDECQTPPYALEPLYPYLPKADPIWECAAGRGTLVEALLRHGKGVLATDINPTTEISYHDFLYSRLFHSRPTIVTNPPYSIKYAWLEKCYEYEMPFALLMPVEMLGTAKGQRLFDKYGIEVIFMSPRVDFYMPNKGWEGGGAQFPTAWFTWKLNLPKQINFATLNKPKRSELEEYWNKALGLY
jgi:hypothetical protein